MSKSVIFNERDAEFLLYEWLKVNELTERDRFREHSRGTFDGILDVAKQIALEHFEPHYQKLDANEPRINADGKVELIDDVKRALDAFSVADLMSAAMDEKVGGFQLPMTVARAVYMWFQAANASTYAYAGLTTAAAQTLYQHGSQELIDRFVPHMASGRFFGVMALSEPEVGSSLGDLTTRGEPQPDGTYRLFGTKMWISGGDQEISENIVALVLARHAGDNAQPGPKGLSLFAVPKFITDDNGNLGERNAITLVGLNHKMGNRGTTNTLLEFGDDKHRPVNAQGEPTSGAVGYLIGREGEGLALMFHMMNEARVFVGAAAASVGQRSHLTAVRYAGERRQGRLPQDKGQGGPMVPIVEHADVRRMLLASKSYAEVSVALVMFCSRLQDDAQTAEREEDREAAALLLDVLTPVAKSFASQYAVKASDLAIQVHGGYGYTRDFPVEQLYRDNRLNPIHEGTHGIQANDLLGRKVAMRGGAGLDLLVRRIAQTCEAAGETAAGADTQAWAAKLRAAVERAVQVTRTVHGRDNANAVLKDAALYLEAMGHIVAAWLWLDMVNTIDCAEAGAGEGAGEGGVASSAGAESDATFYAGKRAAARYFFEYELPHALTLLDVMENASDVLLDVDPKSL